MVQAVGPVPDAPPDPSAVTAGESWKVRVVDGGRGAHWRLGLSRCASSVEYPGRRSTQDGRRPVVPEAFQGPEGSGGRDGGPRSREWTATYYTSSFSPKADAVFSTGSASLTNSEK